MRCPRDNMLDCPSTCAFYNRCKQVMHYAPRITERQAQVLDCLVRGLSNKLLAYELGITETTAKVHVKHCMRETRCINRVQLALWWANQRQVDHVTAP